ncbi:EAL domain-containing protein [Bacillus marinisedimentorum]|uniref:EAL domain-containing protein n=1 Tax=Bacillus marinisedimentorum TaxID=1821260 RepID=UPI000873080A|nr:EAL domain-containing protein [Bacillus marinisedimentorum]
MQANQSLKDTFYHLYQPIYDLDANKIYGYEALLRTGQQMGPEAYFEEKSNHDSLNEADMRSVYQAVVRFFNGYTRKCHLFVNVFPSTLMDERFLKEILQLKWKLKFPAGQVVFEISEAEKISDMQLFKKQVRELKKHGFSIAIDDFGKESSSFERLFELNPSYIKMDKYLAENLLKNRSKQTFLKGFVQSISPKTKLIMEGIEDVRVAEFIHDIGIPLGQGYALGKPDYLSEPASSMK